MRILVSCTTALVLLAGCAASTTPNYDSRFGDAVRQARQMQSINPGPPAAPAVATGTDGKAAAEATTRYHDSFKAPPPVVNVINIGGQISR